MQTAIDELIRDLRATRIAAGLSQADVARGVGCSRSHVGRLERRELGSPSPQLLAGVAAVLGLELRVAAYPDGDPIADRVQLRLLAEFRRRIGPRTAWRTEVPLPIEGDRRAWDAVAIADDGWAGIEVISRLGAVDAQTRRANLKLRDDPRVARVVLVVADTHRNRRALAAGAASIRAEYPLDTRSVVHALRSGALPTVNGIVVLRVPAATDPARPQAVHNGGKLVDDPAAPRGGLVEKRVGAPAPGP
jgi:transcriptional regulator with XRE-family HTH domain